MEQDRIYFASEIFNLKETIMAIKETTDDPDQEVLDAAFTAMAKKWLDEERPFLDRQGGDDDDE